MVSLLALGGGAENLAWADIFSVLFSPRAEHQLAQQILFAFRIPRLVFSFIAGAALAMAGLVFQTLLRNPLADPYLLGISSGASLGSLAARIIFGASFMMYTAATFVGSFLGAILSLLIVLMIAYSGKYKHINVVTLVLAGVVTGTLMSALMFLMTAFLQQNEMATQMLWLMGQIPILKPLQLIIYLGIILASLALLTFYAKSLNLLLLGESVARTSGVSVERLKIFFLVLATLLTSSIVALTGPIGFVGLVVPHATRLILGGDHRLLISANFWLGGAFLVFADFVSRVVLAPTEIPIGVVTAIVGAPYFLFILKKRAFA